MTIFLQTRIYMRTKKPIYMRYKQACVYGVTESRGIRGTELYRQQKTLLRDCVRYFTNADRNNDRFS